MNHNQKKVQKVIENKQRQVEQERLNKQQRQQQIVVVLDEKPEKKETPKPLKTNKKFKKLDGKELDTDMYSAFL